MALTPKRIRLSFLARSTERLLRGFLLLVAFLLGMGYLFLLNRVSMQGYVLTKISEENGHLVALHGQLDAEIAHRQTRKYISESSHVKTMANRTSKQYVIQAPALTAQQQVRLGNNFQ